MFRCQVFELDKKLLQSHAMPYVAAYTWETGTLIRALDMDEFLPPRTGGVPEEELRLRRARAPRRQQRKMRYLVLNPKPYPCFLMLRELGVRKCQACEVMWCSEGFELSFRLASPKGQNPLEPRQNRNGTSARW